jgi:ABC-2 type transport system ATP-binding protein
VFCLLGPNGAGKTTTVEILEGFRAADRGHGHRARPRPGRAARQSCVMRIGIVLQECGFPRQARVGELIDIWRQYYTSIRGRSSDLLEVDRS